MTDKLKLYKIEVEAREDDDNYDTVWIESEVYEQEYDKDIGSILDDIVGHSDCEFYTTWQLWYDGDNDESVVLSYDSGGELLEVYKDDCEVAADESAVAKEVDFGTKLRDVLYIDAETFGFIKWEELK